MSWPAASTRWLLSPVGRKPDGPHDHRPAAMGTPQERQVLGEDCPGAVPRGSGSRDEARRSAADHKYVRPMPAV